MIKTNKMNKIKATPNTKTKSKSKSKSKMKAKSNKMNKIKAKPNKMNKTKKVNKSPKEADGLKIFNQGKKHSKKHSKNYVNIDNIGSTKIMYTEGNQLPKKTILEWDGHYDGKNADIHMNMDVDGKKRQTDLKLTNDDLMKILGANVVNRPIDERLESLDEEVSNMYGVNESSPIMMMALQQQPLQMPLQQQPLQQMPLQMPLQMPYQQQPLPNVPVFINEMPEEMRR